MFKALGNKAKLITEITYEVFGPQVTYFKMDFLYSSQGLMLFPVVSLCSVDDH